MACRRGRDCACGACRQACRGGGLRGRPTGGRGGCCQEHHVRPPRRLVPPPPPPPPPRWERAVQHAGLNGDRWGPRGTRAFSDRLPRGPAALKGSEADPTITQHHAARLGSPRSTDAARRAEELKSKQAALDEEARRRMEVSRTGLGCQLVTGWCTGGDQVVTGTPAGHRSHRSTNECTAALFSQGHMLVDLHPCCPWEPSPLSAAPLWRIRRP